MAVPKYHEFMIPLLEYSIDGSEKVFQEAVEAVADKMNVNPSDRTIRLKHGQRLVANRVGWAVHELKRAGLLEPTARGRFKITNRGKEVLKSNVKMIDRKYLMQFNEYLEYLGKTVEEEEPVSIEEPLELIISKHSQIRKKLVEDLLEEIRGLTDSAFERLVVKLLLKMGYGVEGEESGKVLGRTGDQGIDGVVWMDKLRLDRVYFQAKKWSPDNTIGDSELQKFEGALGRKRVNKGIFITTSRFSVPAQKNIEKNIVLIDGHRLAELMIDHGLGVEETGRYLVHEVDKSYFDSFDE